MGLSLEPGIALIGDPNDGVWDLLVFSLLDPAQGVPLPRGSQVIGNLRTTYFNSKIVLKYARSI